MPHEPVYVLEMLADPNERVIEDVVLRWGRVATLHEKKDASGYRCLNCSTCGMEAIEGKSP